MHYSRHSTIYFKDLILLSLTSGQSIEQTTNRFAHKKGSIASKINEEVAAKKKSSTSPEKKKRKKGSTLSNISKASSDSGLGSDHDLSQRRNLRGRILQVFDEEENDYIKDGDKNNYVDSNFDSVDNSFQKKRDNDNDDDSSDSDNEEDRRRRAKRSQEFRSKMSDYLSREGKFRRMEDSRTPEIGVNDDRRHGGVQDDSISRHSIEFFDDGRGFHSNRSSLRHPSDQSFISPRLNLSESFASRPSRLESIPEAWLIVPDSSRQLNNHQPTQSRLSRAIPVSLKHSIGSRLKVRDVLCLILFG